MRLNFYDKREYKYGQNILKRDCLGMNESIHHKDNLTYEDLGFEQINAVCFCFVFFLVFFFYFVPVGTLR